MGQGAILPQTNGKVERYHQTMAREWGYGVLYRSHRHRERALGYWLRHYNERRPHSALGGQAPISRVRNLLGRTARRSLPHKGPFARVLGLSGWGRFHVATT